MKCMYCNHENLEGEMFCVNCGMKLGGSPPTAPPTAPPSPGEPGVRCENCGFVNPPGTTTCRGCNRPLGVSALGPAPSRAGVCSACGFDKNPPAAKFCMNCGTPITPAAPPGPVAQPPPVAPTPPPPALPAAKLLIVSAMKEIPIPGSGKTIGRADFVRDVSPEDAKYISREHLKIIGEQGKYYVADEGSTNGTKLNGVDIRGQGKKELKNNDEIVLGDTVTLKFQY